MNSRIFLLISIVLGNGPVLGNRNVQDDTLTLERCIAIALERNPLILSSVQEHQAALARINQETAFLYPSVDFNSDLQPSPFDFVNSEEAYLGLSQTFEFPGKRKLRGQIAESESGLFRTDIDLIKLDLALRVKEAFYGLLLALERSSYSERDLALSEEILGMAQLKFSAGDVAQVEVLRARVETLQATNAVRAASDAEKIARARLNSVMARPVGAPLTVTGQLKRSFVDLDMAQLKRDALSSRPELRRIDHRVETLNLRQEQMRLNRRPDFDANLSYHYLQGMPTSWSFSISVPLPFLFSQRFDAEMAEAQASLGALSLTEAYLQSEISLEVEELFIQAMNSRKQIELYENELLPEAEEVYEMFLFSYEEGEIGGFELIEARRTLNEVRLSYADSLFEYALNLATLERAVGRTP
jgi:outer membrane protein TolC